MINRKQTAEVVSPFPKTLRTIKQALNERGKYDANNCSGIFGVMPLDIMADEWSDDERLSYWSGWSDGRINKGY